MLKQIWPQNDFNVISDEEREEVALRMAVLLKRLDQQIWDGLIALNEQEKAKKAAKQQPTSI